MRAWVLLCALLPGLADAAERPQWVLDPARAGYAFAESGCAPLRGDPEQARRIAAAQARAELGRRLHVQVKSEQRLRHGGADASHYQETVRLTSAEVLRGARILRSVTLRTDGRDEFCVLIGIEAEGS